jgi:beta-1,4-mannosyltransferase
MRVGMTPINATNPYTALLADALRARGIDVQLSDLRPWKRPRVVPDVLHIHWPEAIMVSPGAGPRWVAKATAASVLLRKSVVDFQRRGARVIWTAHNAEPNAKNTLRIQKANYAWMASAVDGIIAHSRFAGETVRGKWPDAAPIYLAPHGNYAGVYGPAKSRTRARTSYGITEDEIVVLAFGQLRAYKRLIELARSFSKQVSSPNVRLLVAGAAAENEVARDLHEMASLDRRIVLDVRHIPVDEVSSVYATADFAILNYREVFSSGALLLALSQGVSCFSPRAGTADEIGSTPAIWTFVEEPFERFEEALGVPLTERRSAALGAADANSWSRAAEAHIVAYAGTSSACI